MTQNDSNVTVYGKPDCKPCEFTKKVLDKEGIPYTYLDITVNEVAHQEVKNLGYSGVPVVVAGDDHWTGLHPDRLKGLKNGR